MTSAPKYDIRPVTADQWDELSASIFTGTVSMFEESGFEEVLRRADNRPVMRRYRSSERSSR